MLDNLDGSRDSDRPVMGWYQLLANDAREVVTSAVTGVAATLKRTRTLHSQ